MKSISMLFILLVLVSCGEPAPKPTIKDPEMISFISTLETGDRIYFKRCLDGNERYFESCYRSLTDLKKLVIKEGSSANPFLPMAVGAAVGYGLSKSTGKRK